MAATAGFASFEGHKYLNLETFRKSGEGVRTPIWFAAEPATSLDSPAAKLYVYTVGNTGKMKRMRNNPRVRIAPCDMRGKVLGEWVDANAEIVTGAEAAHGMSLLDKKYAPWKQLLGFFAMFRRQERAVLAIHPA
jgi:PPOX class probable F420-dependent enzyme